MSICPICPSYSNRAEADAEGIISANPEFVRGYILVGLVPLEDERRLLRDRVDKNLMTRLNVQGGLVLSKPLWQGFSLMTEL